MAESELARHRPLRRWVWLGMLPLLILTAIYFVLAVRSAWMHAHEPWPLTPWESAITADAWRINHHRPVYADPVSDHATHMYGPLVTVAAAVGERAFGVDVRVPRAVSLAATFMLSTLAAWSLSRGRSRAAMLLIGGLTFLQFYRLGEWSTEARPDAESALLGLGALLMFYRSARASVASTMLAWMLGGTSLMLAAFYFKQPALLLSIVPPLMAWDERNDAAPGSPRLRWLISVMPIVAIGIVLGVMRVVTPWLWFYMIEIAGGYPISLQRWLAFWPEAARNNLLFLFAAALWLGRPRVSEPVDRWLIVTIVVTTLFGSFALAKTGGGFNSLLPAMIAMTAFAVRVIDEGWTGHFSGGGGVRILLSMLPALLLISDLSVLLRAYLPGNSPVLIRHGDRHYPQAIQVAKGLPGRVVCLDDPTIPLLSKGSAGRCGDCEMDANHRVLPDYALDEIRVADWVIQVKAVRKTTVPDEVLQRLGFVPAAWKIPAGAAYALWHREVGPTSGPTR